MLGHDLRNPLAAVDAGANLLMRGELDQKARKTIGLVKSATHRMVGLVDNILDFARGRLGGGMPIAKVDASPKAVIDQVVAEIRAASPERDIQVEGDFDCTIAHDPTRMAQLLSNLLGNAVMHGDTEAPIRVQANIAANHFELAVVNSGEPIARETLPKLFLPFVRAAQPGQGLGLGLYIASEIAKAHGGELDVLSLGRVTRFSFKMPLK